MDSFWDFQRRERDRGKVRQSKHTWQVRGGRGGKRADIFMFKEKSWRRKKQTNPNNKMKPNPSQRKKGFHTIVMKKVKGTH